MAIRAGPARLSAPNQPPSPHRLSTSTCTDARVLAVARGIRGAGWVAGAGAAAGAGWPCAPRSAAVNASAAITPDRKTLILEIPLPHLLEEPLVLLPLFERLGVTWKIGQILVVSFSESFACIRLRCLGCVLPRQRRDFLIVHGSPPVGVNVRLNMSLLAHPRYNGVGLPYLSGVLTRHKWA